MSKKKHLKDSNKRMGGIMSAINITLPAAIDVSPFVDVTGLHKIKAEIMDLEARISKKSKELESNRSDVVPPTVTKAIVQIATSAWRARSNMIDSVSGEPRDEMKRIFRHVDAIVDTLKQLGVDVIDPVGKAFDNGLALKVVSWEPTEGLSKEEIKETVKPSIIWQGRLVQMGEVIVGTPIAKI